jgi:hypothetical protein
MNRIALSFWIAPGPFLFGLVRLSLEFCLYCNVGREASKSTHCRRFLRLGLANRASRDAHAMVAGAEKELLPEVVMTVPAHLDVEREMSKSTAAGFSANIWTLAVRS